MLTRPSSTYVTSLALTVALGGCGLGAARQAPPPPRDDGPDSLYRDFLEGKTDGAGHPIGATVFEAEVECGAEVGFATDGALVLDPREDRPGSVCRGMTPALGRGPYALNLRAAVDGACLTEGCGPLLVARVLDEAGETLGEREVTADDFREAATYTDVALHFRVLWAGPVHLEVTYEGAGALTIDYVELFRRGRQLVLSPPSGVLDPGSDLRIEVVDPPEDHALGVRCDDVDLGERFSALLSDGTAVEQLTDFRRIVTVPTAALLADCSESTQVVVSLYRSGGVQETSEVRYYAEAPPCAYEGVGETRVLVTGFVPFPAGAQQDNSSMEGVLGFDPASVPGAQVMKLILPVEFANAAALTEDAVERCGPDVVVGFGQGRSRVDLETTAYNIRDTSAVLGGIPDNRGLVVEPAPIRPGGPDTYRTELPVEAIAGDLRDLEIDVSHSDDPGRYVCNDVFYSLGTQPGAETRTTGFVHMPYVREVSDEGRRVLASVVESVVRRTVEVAGR